MTTSTTKYDYGSGYSIYIPMILRVYSTNAMEDCKMDGKLDSSNEKSNKHSIYSICESQVWRKYLNCCQEIVCGGEWLPCYTQTTYGRFATSVVRTMCTHNEVNVMLCRTNRSAWNTHLNVVDRKRCIPVIKILIYPSGDCVWSDRNGLRWHIADITFANEFLSKFKKKNVMLELRLPLLCLWRTFLKITKILHLKFLTVLHTRYRKEEHQRNWFA